MWIDSQGRTAGVVEALAHEAEVGGVVEGLVPVLHPAHARKKSNQIRRNHQDEPRLVREGRRRKNRANPSPPGRQGSNHIHYLQLREGTAAGKRGEGGGGEGGGEGGGGGGECRVGGGEGPDGGRDRRGERGGGRRRQRWCGGEDEVTGGGGRGRVGGGSAGAGVRTCRFGDRDGRGEAGKARAGPSCK